MTQRYLPRTSLLHGPFRMKGLHRALLTLLVISLLCYIFALSTITSDTWKLQNIPPRPAEGRGSGGPPKDDGGNVVSSGDGAYYRESESKQRSRIQFIENIKSKGKQLSSVNINKKKKYQSLGLQHEESAPKKNLSSGLNYNGASASERSGLKHSLNNSYDVKEYYSPENIPASQAGRLLSSGDQFLYTGDNSIHVANTNKEVSGPSPVLSPRDIFVNGFLQPHAAEGKYVVRKGRLRETSTGELHPSTKNKEQSQGDPMAALRGKPGNNPAYVNGARKLREASQKEQDALTVKGDSKPRRSGESLSRSPPHFASSAANVLGLTNSSGDHDAAASSDRLPFDLKRRVWAPWRTDPSCRPLTVHYTHGAPPCALASYPGSGNTWVRYLIETASGIHTGSVYQDDQLYLNGYRGEMESWKAGTTLVQKVHEYSSDLVQSFQGRAVLLLRNPYRAILSFHNFLFGGHKGYAPVANYRRKDWDTFLHMQTKAWLLTAMTWLQEGSFLHVLHYENLLQDPAPQLHELLQDIMAPTTPDRLSCIKKHTSGHFLRQKEYLPDDLKVFSKSVREKIDRAIRYVDFLLLKRNLTPLPLPLYEFYNFTLSDKIVRVPCPKNKTVDECDYYMDQLNRESSIHSPSSQPPSTESPGGTGPPPPPQPREGENGTEHTPLEDTRLTILERLSQHKLTLKLTDAFMNLLEPYSENPLHAMVGNPELKDFLAKPVHFEGAHGLEAEQLARDYIWPVGPKGYKGRLGKPHSQAKEEPR